MKIPTFTAMDAHEILVSTSENNNTAAINLWNHQTTNSVYQYKNGGPIGHHMIAQVQNDYFIGANPKEPKLHLWQMNSREPLKNYRLILPEVASCLSVCPNGIYLAVGIKTHLYIWQLASGKLLTIQRRNMQKISVVKFSGNGSLVIVGGEDGSLSTYKLVHLVSLHKNDLAHREVGQTEPLYSKLDHNRAITDIHVGSFALRSKLATCSLDRTVKIYKLTTGDLIQNIITENIVFSIVTDSCFGNAYIGCSNGTILTFKVSESVKLDKNHHLTSEEIAKKNSSFDGHTKAVKCLCLNQDATTLASGGDDGYINIWEIKSRNSVASIDLNSPVTNLRFILNHKNIWSENFQVTSAIVDLEMNMNLSDTNFGILVLKASSLEDFKKKRGCEEDKEEIEKLKRENMNLRATNQQMYEFTLELLKRNKDKK